MENQVSCPGASYTRWPPPGIEAYPEDIKCGKVYGVKGEGGDKVTYWTAPQVSIQQTALIGSEFAASRRE